MSSRALPRDGAKPALGGIVRAAGPGGWLRLTPLAAWGLLALATTYVLAFNPTDRIADPSGPCLWHSTFGIDGPTCGGTRMYWHLIHADLIQAGRHHLAALVGLLYGCYALSIWTMASLLVRPVKIWAPSRRAIIWYLVAFMVYAVVLRNLPWAPFTWLYVPNLT